MRTLNVKIALRWAGLASVLASASAPAWADVLAIGADGSIAARSGEGAVRWARPGGDAGPAGASHDGSDPALTLIGTTAIPARYAAATVAAAEANGLSADLLAAVVWQESRWRADARSSAGAIGLAQLMPGTAGGLGVDPADPVANLYGAARYLRVQIDRFGGDIERALAAYNAGPARVVKAGGIPAIAETRTYVASIIGRLSAAPDASTRNRPALAWKGN